MAPLQVSAMDKLGLVPLLMKSMFVALTQLLTSPIRSGKRPDRVFKDVAYAVLRSQLASISIPQERYLDNSTESTYLNLAKKEGFQPDSIVLSDGSKGHWLGPKNKDKVMVYFHGGGYVLSASPGHCQWVYDLTKSLSAKYSFTSILLGYTTAPEGQYPKQLNQAVELLDTLLKEGRKPSDIILAGDSAGGNLTLGVLSHLLHPHPDISIRPKVDEPFRAAVLISPWVKFATEDSSHKRNFYTDMLPPAAAKRWSSAFLGSAPLDNYNQPVLADSSWFRGLDGLVKEVLVWGGGGEVLIDSIDDIANKLKEAHPKTEYIVQPNVAHEDFIIMALLGYKSKAEGTEVVESWISSRL